MPETTNMICLNCTDEFSVLMKEVKRGNGRFCSRSCSNSHRSKIKKLAIVPNCVCANCNLAFYKVKSKFRNSRSGFHFCSRKCKDDSQRIHSPHRIIEIMPNHYGTGEAHYREIAFRVKERKCEDCNFNEVPEVLVVHHIDENRSNNVPENLKVLCPTCHEIEHFKRGSGRFWALKSIKLPFV